MTIKSAFAATAVAALTLTSTASLAATGSIQVAVETFTDTFTTGPSPLWNNAVGNWTAVSGAYLAQAPNNIPFTNTQLPFVLGDLSVSVDVNAASDGGIWLHSEGTNQNGILLIIGGNGYGGGNRSSTAGTALYFHKVQNGSVSPQLAQVDNLFTPGTNHTFSVVVTGNLYEAYLDGVLKTSYTDTANSFPTGRVGLYDYGTASPRQSFDNFSVTATSLPEPTLALAAFPALTLLRRRR